MSLRILSKRALDPLVKALMADYRVIGPKAARDKFAFGPIEDPADLRLDYDTSLLPPSKVALLPPEECLVELHMGEEEPLVETVIEAEPTVLLGVHTCDLTAIQLLDRAFTEDYVDVHYQRRREQTLIISLECLDPCDENSFCKDMGTLSAEGGYDLHLTDLGDEYLVEIGTEAGARLLRKYAQTRAATEEDVDEYNRVLQAKWPRFAHRLSFPAAELPLMMADAYEDPLWEELGEKCLACGSCTNVCPTCYCFNVVDSMNLTQTTATRTRKWACCQLDEFAEVASGENFREARADRQRHRFFRKGKWIPDRFDVLGCVGCGRCVRTCLVHIDIAEGFNTIRKSQAEAA